jgi:ribosomal protein S18 acetylase RimI-like enzyme
VRQRRTIRAVKATGGRRVGSSRSARTRKTGTTKATRAKLDRSPELTFRPRTEADDEYIVQLTEEQLGGVHQQAFREPFPREQFRRYIQSGAPTTVVENHGKRIGYYSYLIGPDGKMHISALVIDQTQQSDGIGAAVMRKLEQEAVARGVHTLEVFVQANNERSVHFTRKLGFTEMFRFPPNTICFQKRIRAQSPTGGQVAVPPSAANSVPAQGPPTQVPGPQAAMQGQMQGRISPQAGPMPFPQAGWVPGDPLYPY